MHVASACGCNSCKYVKIMAWHGWPAMLQTINKLGNGNGVACSSVLAVKS